MKSGKEKTVLVVDDEPDLLISLRVILVREGYEVHTAATGTEALEKAGRLLPDLILLDVMLPDLDGKKVKIRLNEDKMTADIPVIFLSAKGAVSDRVEGLGLLADDYIVKPYEPRELLARVANAIAQRRRYEEISMTDGLTGLPNYQAFQREIEIFLDIARRYGRRFSMAVIDVNDLKKINDTFGHSAGDRVIKEVSMRVRRQLRTADCLFRYAGDEFIILFPECGTKEASEALERCKQDIAGAKIFPEQSGPLVVSAGVASWSENIRAGSELFDLADKQMYREKNMKKTQSL